jgi:hypothetical protein
MKEGHYIRDIVLLKEWLEKKGIQGHWSRKVDRVIKV